MSLICRWVGVNAAAAATGVDAADTLLAVSMLVVLISNWLPDLEPKILDVRLRKPFMKFIPLFFFLITLSVSEPEICEAFSN